MQQGKPESVRDYIHLAYTSFLCVKHQIAGKLDRDVRHPEWTGRLLEQFGCPDGQAYNVMVAGSKGKGSHAILLAAMLQRAGLKTGLFTGPHHVDFMERFRVDGRVIPETDFCRLMERVDAAVSELPLPADQYVGPVGILAVIAALWFREQAIDVGIYECGRGARHDDVNQIRHDGAVLTPVFLEHQEQLGETLQEIASEKLAVVSTDTRWLACAKQQPTVRTQIDALRLETTFWAEDDLFYHVVRKPSWLEVQLDAPDGRTVLRLPWQLDLFVANAITAFSAARAVWRDLRSDIPFPELLDLSDVRLPGRMDILAMNPLMMLDGTIHRDSAEFVAAFARQALDTGRVQRFGILASLPADKDGEGVLATLSGCADWLILTETTNPHLHYGEGWQRIADKYYTDVAYESQVEAALTLGKARLAQVDGLLMVGTQSFVGDILRLFGEETCPIWREATE